MAKWFLGTMGFSYKDWRGPFYPEDVENRDYLGYYSQIFNAVEIDSTFYGSPREDVVQRWNAITPKDFRFSVKTPKAITHEAGLVGVTLQMRAFLNTVQLLGEKLGIVLLQMPPSYQSSQFEGLQAFLENLPKEMRFAVEFRHFSWYTAKTEELLAQHGVSWVASEFGSVPKKIYLTNRILYMRFLGVRKRFPVYNQERIDVTPNLNWWLEKVRQVEDQLDEIHGFFNDDYAGFAPGTTNRFKGLAGLPINERQPPLQPSLF